MQSIPAWGHFEEVVSVLIWLLYPPLLKLRWMSFVRKGGTSYPPTGEGLSGPRSKVSALTSLTALTRRLCAGQLLIAFDEIFRTDYVYNFVISMNLQKRFIRCLNQRLTSTRKCANPAKLESLILNLYSKVRNFNSIIAPIH